MPDLRFPLITEWFWARECNAPHQTQVHGAVHYPRHAEVPWSMVNHGPISTSRIRQLLSVQYGLVRTLSGSIYQLHAPSRHDGCPALAQRPVVVAYDLLYLHTLLEQGRASLLPEALLSPWWTLSASLFVMVLQHVLPYVRTI